MKRALQGDQSVAKPVIGLVISVSLLFLMGLLMIFNTTAAEIIDRNLPISTHSVLIRQLIYGFVGVVVGFAAYRVGYRRILMWSTPLALLCTLCLLVVFVPAIGQVVNGSRRWISLWGYTFQPSECAKLILPLCFVRWVVSQKGSISYKEFLKRILFFSIPIALILIEPDTGATIIIVLTFLLLFVLCRIPWMFWSLPLVVLCAGAGVVASQMPHVRSRIQVYLHPELDLRGKGHQPHQAKIATGSGKLFGRGFGESLQKMNYLPEARSDYIAAIYAEEGGFVGVAFLIALYIILFYSGISIAMRARERAPFLVAATLSFLIAVQAFINLGVVCGLLPSKGMTLPFFSQGGSSLVVHFISFFLLVDLSRTSSVRAYEDFAENCEER